MPEHLLCGFIFKDERQAFIKKRQNGNSGLVSGGSQAQRDNVELVQLLYWAAVGGSVCKSEHLVLEMILHQCAV